MKCTLTQIAGLPVILCGRSRFNVCCVCRAPASKLCDWKIDSYHTCDKPLCEKCTHSPAPEKDLCPVHWEIWQKHPENPANGPQRELPL